MTTRNQKQLLGDVIENGGPVPPVDRPKTRAECLHGPRPCPYVACKHNLYLDVTRRLGSLQFNFPDIEPDQMKHSCALDGASDGGLTLCEIGERMNVTRERVRQMEANALRKLGLTPGELAEHVEGRCR